MDFKTALKTVYEKWNSNDEMNEPFILYSRIADVIGNSYEDKKKLSLFFTVAKRLNLFTLVSKRSLEKIDKIRRKLYEDVAYLLSENAFNRLIDILIEVAAAASDTKVAEKKEISDFGKSKKRLKIFSGVFLCLSGAVLLICGVLRVCWNEYQWLVGFAVAITLLICISSVSAFVNKNVFDCVALGMLSIINFILYCVFKTKYKVICYWVSAAILLLNLCFLVKDFNDDEAVFRRIFVGEYYLTVLVILLSIFQ